MLTIQHTLITLILLDGNVELLREIIPYVLLPDAIRRYTGNRQASHYELNSDGSDVSRLQYPKNIKNLKNDKNLDIRLANNIKSAAIGEKSIVTEFNKTHYNYELIYNCGVQMHLIQDKVYDEFVRTYIGHKDKYNDNYVFGNKIYNGKEIRIIITSMENYGVAFLANWIYTKYGIITNQKWFDTNIKTSLYREYSKDLAENTYKYMILTNSLENLINNLFKDGYLAVENITMKEYKDMYERVILLSNPLAIKLKRNLFKVIDRQKDRSGNIISYIIENYDGFKYFTTPLEIKNKLKNREVEFTNLKLTSDNRLILNKEK